MEGMVRFQTPSELAAQSGGATPPAAPSQTTPSGTPASATPGDTNSQTTPKTAPGPTTDEVARRKSVNPENNCQANGIAQCHAGQAPKPPDKAIGNNMGSNPGDPGTAGVAGGAGTQSGAAAGVSNGPGGGAGFGNTAGVAGGTGTQSGAAAGVHNGPGGGAGFGNSGAGAPSSFTNTTDQAQNNKSGASVTGDDKKKDSKNCRNSDCKSGG